MSIKFADLTAAEFETVRAIATRADAMYRSAGVMDQTPMDTMMDIECCHATIPLRLDELLAADDFNFSHDVGGIRRHLNRRTGEMENCFVPRFAVHEMAVA
jgi:hypothetical protein